VELAVRNARLNGLDAAASFERGDGEELLKELARAPADRRPEVVFIDPPNFAHHKAALEAARYAYVRLFARGFKLVPNGGLVGLSTCSGLVSAPLFRKIVEHAARQAKRRIEPVAFRGQSEDHPVLEAMPETAYLHFGLLRVVG
jgi:23S rRNA (cytosine1962-C5)-methyltransferase